MRRPTLFLMVGIPASGKTTAARQLEGDRVAIRLTKDEWMKALYGEKNPESASDVIEGRLISIPYDSDPICREKSTAVSRLMIHRPTSRPGRRDATGGGPPTIT